MAKRPAAPVEAALERAVEDGVDADFRHARAGRAVARRARVGRAHTDPQEARRRGRRAVLTGPTTRAARGVDFTAGARAVRATAPEGARWQAAQHAGIRTGRAVASRGVVASSARSSGRRIVASSAPSRPRGVVASSARSARSLRSGIVMPRITGARTRRPPRRRAAKIAGARCAPRRNTETRAGHGQLHWIKGKRRESGNATRRHSCIHSLYRRLDRDVPQGAAPPSLPAQPWRWGAGAPYGSPLPRPRRRPVRDRT